MQRVLIEALMQMSLLGMRWFINLNDRFTGVNQRSTIYSSMTCMGALSPITDCSRNYGITGEVRCKVIATNLRNTLAVKTEHSPLRFCPQRIHVCLVMHVLNFKTMDDFGRGDMNLLN